MNVTRTIGAIVCGAAVLLSEIGDARASTPPEATTDEVVDQAALHVTKAVQHFDAGAYRDAEEEFRRVAFFAPHWRPLHFNLAVVAEAQGKIGTAVSEYQPFRPLAMGVERPLVEQRIDELTRRRETIERAYRKQIALSSVALTFGVAALGGGSAMIVLARNVSSERRNGVWYGGGYLAAMGLLAIVYSVIPLSQAIRSGRQQGSLALGRTRVRWTAVDGLVWHF